jgi:hypothetical protein
MSTTTTITRYWTVTQAAEELGVTRALVNLRCRELSVGEFYGSYRLLSDDDLNVIRNRPDARKKSQDSA